MKFKKGQTLCREKSLGQTLCGEKTLRGQTLFELIVALAVTVLIVTGIVRIVTLSVRNAIFAKNQAEATRYSQESLEWMREERDKDWDAFLQRSDTVWCLKNLSWEKGSPCASGDQIQGSIFTREATLTSTVAESIQVLVSVRWSDSIGSHEARTGTVFTRWRNADQ